MLNLKKILQQKANIIVSGSSGFIGFNFVEYVLKNSKIKVYAYREKQINTSNNFRLRKLKDYTNFILIDHNSIGDIKDPIQLVINFASYGVDSTQKDIKQMAQGNIDFSLKMISIAENFNAKYVHTSTCYEYKHTKNKINESTSLFPESMYGAFKAAASIIVEQVCKYKNIDCVILCLFGVYGPNESGDKILPYLYKTLSLNNKVELTDGRQVRDYTFITDVIGAYLLVAFNKNKRIKYNICSSEGIKIRDFILKFSEIGGFNKSLLLFGKIVMTENSFMKVIGDNSSLVNEYGWLPEVLIEDGMRSVLDEFKKMNYA
jgi:nucleoside-diphosphate-sugar epimerase